MLPTALQKKMSTFFLSQGLPQKFKQSISYSLYQKQLEKKQEFYSWQHSNQTKQRRIFYNVNYSTDELLAIYKVKMLDINQKLQNKQSKKQQSRVIKFTDLTDQVILKHVHATGFNIQETFQRLQVYTTIIGQIVNSENVQQGKIVQSLQKGMIYTFGHTKQGFPIIILRIDLVDTSKTMEQNFSIFHHILSTVLHYKMKPHYCQKYIFIMDLNNMSFTQIDYKYLYKFMMKIGILYCGMNDKIFVFNSEKIGMLWSLVKSMLPEHIVKKVDFIRNHEYTPLYQIVDKNQLQQKYGGNLQNVDIFWPPQVPSQYLNNKSNLNISFNDNQENETQYYSFQNNESKYKSIAAKTNKSYKTLGITTKKCIQLDQSNLTQGVSLQRELTQRDKKSSLMCGQACNCSIY